MVAGRDGEEEKDQPGLEKGRHDCPEDKGEPRKIMAPDKRQRQTYWFPARDIRETRREENPVAPASTPALTLAPTPSRRTGRMSKAQPRTRTGPDGRKSAPKEPGGPRGQKPGTRRPVLGSSDSMRSRMRTWLGAGARVANEGPAMTSPRTHNRTPEAELTEKEGDCNSRGGGVIQHERSK